MIVCRTWRSRPSFGYSHRYTPRYLCEYPKDGLDLHVLQTIMYAKCYELRVSGLYEGTPVEVRHMDPDGEFEENYEQYVIYQVDGNRMNDLGCRMDAEGVPTFTYEGEQVVFTMAIVQPKIDHSEVLGVIIAASGMAAAVFYIKRRGA